MLIIGLGVKIKVVDFAKNFVNHQLNIKNFVIKQKTEIVMSMDNLCNIAKEIVAFMMVVLVGKLFLMEKFLKLIKDVLN